MAPRFEAMNYQDGLGVGVIEHGDKGFSWVVEPDFNWTKAKRMAAALNDNPGIDPDELYKVAEVVK